MDVKVRYKFTKIQDIASLSSGSDVDILAWVRQTGDLVQFTAKSGQDYKKRELLLADNSGPGGASISMVLWGKEAEEFSDNDKIIAVRKARVKEFNGAKNISGGTIDVSPTCSEVADLDYWVSGMRDAINIIAPSQSQVPGTQSGLGVGVSVTIQEIKDAMAEDRSEKKFNITGYIVKVWHLLLYLL